MPPLPGTELITFSSPSVILIVPALPKTTLNPLRSKVTERLPSSTASSDKAASASSVRVLPSVAAAHASAKVPYETAVPSLAATDAVGCDTVYVPSAFAWEVQPCAR